MGEQDQDALFLEIARARGFLSAAQADELREDQALFAARGYARKMTQIVAEKGLLSRDRIREVRCEMQKRGILPRIGGYEVIAKLGEGGMGAVYKARQLSLDRLVALKVLPPELAREKDYLERFRREGRIAACLTHANAVRVYDVGHAGGYHYMAMEYVDGTPVDRLIVRGGMPEEKALAIVRGIAAALVEAHGKGIVHRDIKPSNIMLARDGQPKLLDLGIARQAGVATHTLTQTGTTLGTAHYMSPEQCRGRRDIDARSDIYSLGATLYHLVCGRTPYDGETTTAIMLKHIDEPLVDPRVANPQLSPATAELIKRMMAKDRAERVQTCAELMKILAPPPLESARVEDAQGEPPQPASDSPASCRAVDWRAEERCGDVATPRGWAKRTIIFYANSLGMEFVLVPAGEFMMGSPADEKDRFDDEGPQHKVVLTHPFYMGKTVVTQAPWQAVTGDNPSSLRGADNPVDNVSWDDCQDFLYKLCAKEGVPEGTYRLPTEAEWEYACRAGTQTRFCSGDADGVLDEVAWYWGNSGGSPHPVGRKAPNAWGLYDMHGNVGEWCSDWYASTHSPSPATDPQGPATGTQRVLRGGYWGNFARYCRSAARGRNQPEVRYRCGLRIVSVVPPESGNATDP